MAKMKLQQILGLALSTIMLVGLTACGSNDPKESETKTQSVVQSSETTSTEQTSTESLQPEDVTYPVQTDVKLQVWQGGYVNKSSDYESYETSPFHSGLAERPGVEVEWLTYPKGSSSATAFNLLWLEEEKPDIIYYATTAAEAEEYYEAGLIYDLTEYLPIYAPDYWETLNRPEYANVLKEVTSPSGKQLMFVSFPEGDYNVTYQGPIVRKDWLDACGLDVPVTIADWEEMLTAFKDKYGYALGVSKDVLKGEFFLNSGVGSFGNLAARFYVDDNNQICFAQNTPEYKEWLTVLNRWYKNGLLDMDSLSMDSKALRNKAVNNELGASFVPSSQYRNFLADATAAENGAEWVGVEYPKTAVGEPACVIQSRYSYWNGNAQFITTDCSEEELITALKWLNYGFTEEGHNYWNFGTVGVSYTLNSEGLPEWTDYIKEYEKGLTESVKRYAGCMTMGISLQSSRLIQLNNAGVAGEAIDTWISNTNAADHLVPRLPLTGYEDKIYSAKFPAISTYVSEMGQKFIVGDESLDNYDAYVTELNNIGLGDCLKAYQTAYDRFISN